MRKYLLFHLFIVSSFVSFSQANTQTERECRIASGFGIASATQSVKSPGTDLWIQMDYRILKSVSVATEYENMTYKRPGYHDGLPVDPNEVQVYNDNFSVLLKYHFTTSKKLKISLASGWTHTTEQEDYYIYEDDGVTKHWFRNISSFSDYRIPFLAEVGYPLSKSIDIQGRVKYNLSSESVSSYAGGIGLSLRL
jgi:hypothetical protein